MFLVSCKLTLEERNKVLEQQYNETKADNDKLMQSNKELQDLITVKDKEALTKAREDLNALETSRAEVNNLTEQVRQLTPYYYEWYQSNNKTTQ